VLKMAARKKRSYARSAAPRRSYAPRRRSYRKKSGTTYIPSAAATVGVAIANKDAIMNVVNDMSVNGVKNSIRYAIQPEQIKKDIIYGGAGLVAGAAIKKFAPRAIKTPLGKIAKKIPRFF